MIRTDWKSLIFTSFRNRRRPGGRRTVPANAARVGLLEPKTMLTDPFSGGGEPVGGGGTGGTSGGGTGGTGEPGGGFGGGTSGGGTPGGGGSTSGGDGLGGGVEGGGGGGMVGMPGSAPSPGGVNLSRIDWDRGVGTDPGHGGLALSIPLVGGSDLIYRSDADGRSVLAASVAADTFAGADGGAVSLTLKIDGVADSTTHYDVTGQTTSQLRFAVRPSAALPTGRHDVELVFDWAAGGLAKTHTLTDGLLAEDRTVSPLGDRWAVDGLEFLHVSAAGAMYGDSTHTLAWFEGDLSAGSPIDGSGVLHNSTLQFDAAAGRYTLTGRLGGTSVFDAAGKLLSKSDPNGNAITYAWNPDATLASIADQYGRAVALAYGSDGLLDSVTDWAGRQMTFTHDADGRLTAVMQDDPDGAPGLQSAPVRTFTHDADGRVASVTDPVGRTTTFAYGPADRLASVTRPGGGVTGYVPLVTRGYPAAGTGTPASPALPVDAASATSTVTDPTGGVTTRTYRSGEVASVTDPLGAVTTIAWAFDPMAGTTRTVTRPDPDGAGPLTAPVTTVAYSSQMDVTSVTDPLNRVTTYARDAAGRVLSVTDPLGNTTSTTYDAAGNVLTVTDALSGVSTFTYDALGRTLTATDAESAVTAWTYDAHGRVDTVTDALGSVWAYGYTTYDRVTSVTDPSGRVRNHVFDQLDRPIGVSDPDPDGAGPLTSRGTWTTYNLAGDVLTTTDFLGHVTAYAYDAAGRLASVTLPDPDGAGPRAAPVTGYTYDAAGRLLTQTDPLGHVITYAYDAAGRLTTLTDALGNVTTFAYDALGRSTSLTDARGFTTTTAYDAAGQVTSTTLPDPDGAGPLTSSVISYSYDSIGRTTSVTDSLGNVTTYAYDALHRLTSETDAESAVVAYTYDDVGRMTSLTDQVGNVTSWTFDAVGQTLTETNEAAATRSYTYDSVGRLETKTDRDGRRSEFTYDPFGRLSTEEWIDSDGTTVLDTITRTYDAGDRLTSIADGDSSLTYTLDALALMTAVSNAGTTDVPTVVLTDTLDNAGRATAQSAVVNGVADYLTTWTRDAIGRVTSVTQQGQAGGTAVSDKRVDFAYDAAGRLSTVDRYESLGTTAAVAASAYAFDDAGRLTDLDHTTADGATTLAFYDWTYDAAGRLTQTASADGTAEFSYDDTGQLLGVDNSVLTDETYTYDAAGNRTLTGYTHGDANRLTSDGTYDYEYDLEGRRTKRTEIASGDYVEYEWDHGGRLTAVFSYTSADVVTKSVTYRYDAHGRRIAKDVDDNGDSTVDRGERYVWDGAGGFGHVDDVVLTFDEAGDLEHRYLHGPLTDQVLVDEVMAGGAVDELLWSLADHQGTVRDWANRDDSTGVTTVSNHLTFDAFGNVLSKADATHEVTYAYTGREWDADVGLYYYRARWYDSHAGRFVSEDPVGFWGGDTNTQAYVGNSTTLFNDPTGNWWHIVAGAIAGAFVGWINDDNGGVDGIVVGAISGGVTAATFSWGVGVLTTTETGLLGTASAGVVSGAGSSGLGSGVTEGLDYVISAGKDPFDLGEIGEDAATGAVVGILAAFPTKAARDVIETGSAVGGVGNAADAIAIDALIGADIVLVTDIGEKFGEGVGIFD